MATERSDTEPHPDGSLTQPEITKPIPEAPVSSGAVSFHRLLELGSVQRPIGILIPGAFRGLV